MRGLRALQPISETSLNVMAHVRRDTLTKSLEWWKHLKWRKRDQAKRERQAAKREIRDQLRF
jgi:hypothetical protein